MPKKLPLVLALDNVRSLHNVGAIFRTADGANISQILLGGLSPTPPRHEIEKTALGTLASVPWHYDPDPRPSLRRLKSEGYTLVALEQTPHSRPLFETRLPFPLVLVVGHEREGVQPDILKLCDFCLDLPMRGTAAHSLNVSTATGIALYEAVRQFWYHE